MSTDHDDAMGIDHDQTGRNDGARTIEEEVKEQASILTGAFGLPPDTARVIAEDKVSSRMRQPASDDVEEKRVAEAQAMNAAADDDGMHVETRKAEDVR